MEGENKQLNIVTYNCNVFNDKKCLFIRELFQSCDFLLLQEHGQYKSRLDILSCIDENAVYCGSFAMDESVLLSGRPHGGTAIIWKSNVAYNVIPIQCKSVTLHEKLTLSTFKFSLKTFFKHLYTPLRLPLSIS